MNEKHPSAAELDRYRRRTAAAAELLAVDAHIASCDACLAALRDSRHLTYEQAEAYVDGSDDRAVRDHVAVCAMCRAEVDDLAKMREVVVAEGGGRAAGGGTAWRWAAAAAVILVFAALVAVMFRREHGVTITETTATQQQQPPPQIAALKRPAILDTLIAEAPVLRGEPSDRSFALRKPVGTVVVDDRPTLRWDAVPGATSYTVAIARADDGSVVVTGSTAAESWRPEVQLARGRTYTWQVTAKTPGGSIVAPGSTGAEARFHVGAPFEEKGSYLQRGVALANLGALDEAERQLELAGATELVAEIRTWRQRASPTTTNGAQ